MLRFPLRATLDFLRPPNKNKLHTRAGAATRLEWPDEAIDGIKICRRGNVFVTGPGGLWILSPEGNHLGTLRGPEHPHNLAWGQADRQTVCLTAQTGIYRIRLNNPGAVSVTASARGKSGADNSWLACR